MDRKVFLNELIYRLNQQAAFLSGESRWLKVSSPAVGFAFDDSLNGAFLDLLYKRHWIKETRDDVVCLLQEWQRQAYGIFFTTKAMYFRSRKNRKSREFKVRYANIKELQYDEAEQELTIITYGKKAYIIQTGLWNKRDIKIFLEFASKLRHFDEQDRTVIDNLTMDCYGGQSLGTILDELQQKEDTTVGADTAPAPVKPVSVPAVVNIQSVYYSSGKKCIRSCFTLHGQGTFKYMKSDGTPMRIEVPLDKYEAAVQAMAAKIKNGQVPTVTDPAAARELVCKGAFTYEQAKNIAQSGTVESLTFDSVHGTIVTTNAMLITTILGFSVAVWNGDDMTEAAKQATYMGLKVGGSIWATSILASQVVSTGVDAAVISGAESLAAMLGPDASAMLVRSLGQGVNVYGAAAMRSAATVLRGNIITGTITVVMLSASDIVHIFKGRISGAQLFKNIMTTTAGVASGFGGWVAGAAAGGTVGSIFPGIGTAIGSVVGAILASLGAANVGGNLSRKAMNTIIADDTTALLGVIEERIIVLSKAYLLSRDEVENVVDNLGADLTIKVLQAMHASADKKAYADELLKRYINIELSHRAQIHMPDHAAMGSTVVDVLEEMGQ